MEATHLSHKIFKMAPLGISEPLAAPQIMSAHPSSIPYLEIMLCEYYHMVNALIKLTDLQLQTIQDDVNNLLDKLTKWLDNIGSVNTIELFSAMRHLKQTTYALTKQAGQKAPLLNHNLHKKLKNSDIKETA